MSKDVNITRLISRYNKTKDFRKIRDVLSSDYYELVSGDLTAALIQDVRLKKHTIMQNLDVLPTAVVIAQLDDRKFDLPFCSQLLAYYIMEKEPELVEGLTHALVAIYQVDFLTMVRDVPIKLQYPEPVMIPFNRSSPGMRAVFEGISRGVREFIPLKVLRDFWYILYGDETVLAREGGSWSQKKYLKERAAARENLVRYASAFFDELAAIKFMNDDTEEDFVTRVLGI